MPSFTVRSELPEAVAEQTIRSMNRLSEQFASIVVDGIVIGSVRPVDPPIASQMSNGMINASASVKRWVPGATINNVADLYARPPCSWACCSIDSLRMRALMPGVDRLC